MSQFVRKKEKGREGADEAPMKYSLASVVVVEPGPRVIRRERPEHRSGMMMRARLFRWSGWRCAPPKAKGSIFSMAGGGLRAFVCLRARRERNTINATARLMTPPTTPPTMAPMGGEDLLEPEAAVEVARGAAELGEIEPAELEAGTGVTEESFES